MKRLLAVLIFSLVISIAKAQDSSESQSSKKNEGINDTFPDQPTFPGGQSAYFRFLKKNLRLPKKQKAIHGRVVVNFYVEKSGNLTNVKIIYSSSQAFGVEALRVVKKFPKWIPAMQNGGPVGIQYSLPINFTLSE